MCNPALLIGTLGLGLGMTAVARGERAKKKSEAENKAKLEAANTYQEEQIAHNQLANSVQTTAPLKNPTLAEELKKQKVPLNTGSTGVTTASPTSVGLNLGGY